MRFVYVERFTTIVVVFRFVLLFLIWTNEIALSNIIKIKIVVLFASIVLTT